MTSQSSELNYTPVMANHSAPRMSRVYPLNPPQSPFNMSTVAQEVQFELPNKVYNLARSNLEFKINVASAGAGRSNALHLSGVPIDRISLFSREGVYLCDMPNFQQLSKAVTPYLTCRENSKNCDGWNGTDDVSNNTSSFSYNSITDGAGVATISSGGKSISNDDSFASMDKLAIAGDASSIRVRLPLKEIHHSLMSCDRVMYFGQSLILRVHLASAKGFGFSFDTVNIADLSLANLGPIGTVTISELKVNLAVETSPDIIEGLVARVQSAGLQVMTPYTYGFLYTTGRGQQNVSVQQRLNAGHGQRLLYAISSHFDNNANVATSSYLDNSNIDESGVITKVKRYQTSMDNNNLTEYVVDTSKGEDFELHKPSLMGSTVKDTRDYQETRVHLDSWRGGKTCSWRERDGTEVDGLSLESERIHNMNVEEQVTNDPALGGDLSYRVYSWFVCQRTLTIQPNGQIVIA